MICLEAVQGLFEHAECEVLVAAVCADLRHEENLIALAAERGAHPVLGFTAMVFPAVVEEIDAAIDRLMDEAGGGGLVFRVAQMMAAKAQRRYLNTGPTETPPRNPAIRGLHGIERSRLSADVRRDVSSGHRRAPGYHGARRSKAADAD